MINTFFEKPKKKGVFDQSAYLIFKIYLKRKKRERKKREKQSKWEEK